jgi:hypothetical protein
MGEMRGLGGRNALSICVCRAEKPDISRDIAGNARREAAPNAVNALTRLTRVTGLTEAMIAKASRAIVTAHTDLMPSGMQQCKQCCSGKEHAQAAVAHKTARGLSNPERKCVGPRTGHH